MAFPNENQKIYMITGKGGVGKSVVSAALAQNLAQKGLKTLLVELGDISYFAQVYKKDIGYEPTKISSNFSISLWRGESCLREYVYHLVRVRRIVDLFFDNRVMQTFIKAAPALKELAILGKITSGIRAWGPELPYDVIVVDAFSTGHFQALLNAPRGMAELIQSGPMGEQSRKMVEVLGRNDLVKYKVVTLAEELPAAEAVEQVQQLKNSFQVTSEIILNRYYESPISTGEVAAVRQQDLNQSAAQFAEYLENLLHRQESQLKWLQQRNPIEKVLPWVLQSEAQKVICALQGRL